MIQDILEESEEQEDGKREKVSEHWSIKPPHLLMSPEK